MRCSVGGGEGEACWGVLEGWCGRGDVREGW